MNASDAALSRGCLACDEGVPLVNVTADRDDLPDLWTHQYGGNPGTTSPCKKATMQKRDAAANRDEVPGKYLASTSQVHATHRFDLGFHVGPCTVEEAEGLAEALLEMPEAKAVGIGAVVMNAVDDNDEPLPWPGVFPYAS